MIIYSGNKSQLSAWLVVLGFFCLALNFCKKQKKVLFINVLQKHGKVPYKAQLQASGVAFISVEDVKVVKKTATGPVSGSVFEAIWTKPNGEKVRI